MRQVVIQTNVDCLLSFCCLVQLMLKGIGSGGLGEKMYSAHSLDEELPQAVEMSRTDPPLMTSVKEMVLQMTAYDAKDRPSANTVLRSVQSVYQKVCEYLYTFVVDMHMYEYKRFCQ